MKKNFLKRKSIGDSSDITYQLNLPKISNEEIQSYIESVKSEYGVQKITAEFVAGKCCKRLYRL